MPCTLALCLSLVQSSLTSPQPWPPPEASAQPVCLTERETGCSIVPVKAGLSRRLPACSASVPGCLGIGLHLFHDLRGYGAVHAGQAPRVAQCRERVPVIDGCQFAAAYPYLARTEQVVRGQDRRVMG